MKTSDADVGQQFRFATQSFRRDDRLLGDGQIAGSGCNYYNPANRRANNAAESRQPESVRDSILFGLGKIGSEVRRLLRVYARGETILARFDEPPNHPFDPFGRFPFAKDYFGKAATLPAVEVHLCVAEVADGGGLHTPNGRVHAQSPGLDLFQQGS